MYDEEEPEDGDREKEEKGKKPAKKKRVQRPPRARPATKAKKRPREGQQQEGSTDGKKQQPAQQQQEQQLTKPEKAPKDRPSKAKKRAKAKEPQPSKARYEVIAPKQVEQAPTALTKKQLKAARRLAEAREEAEEDRIAELAHRPFYTHEGEKVRAPLARVLHQMDCCSVSHGSAQAQGLCACHLVMQRFATALGLLAACWASDWQVAAAHCACCASPGGCSKTVCSEVTLKLHAPLRCPWPFCSAPFRIAHICTVWSGCHSPQVLAR